MCNASIQYLYEETNNLYLNEKVSLFFVGTKFEILYQVPLDTAETESSTLSVHVFNYSTL